MKAIESRARCLAEQLQTILEEVHGMEKREAAAHEELSWQELRALHALGRGDCCPMRRLADSICLSMSSATGIIDRLVAKKFARRERDGDDRRVVQVGLTREGREIRERTLGGAAAQVRDILEVLDDAEQERLLDLLGKVVVRIEERRLPS